VRRALHEASRGLRSGAKVPPRDLRPGKPDLPILPTPGQHDLEVVRPVPRDEQHACVAQRPAQQPRVGPARAEPVDGLVHRTLRHAVRAAAILIGSDCYERVTTIIVQQTRQAHVSCAAGARALVQARCRWRRTPMPQSFVIPMRLAAGAQERGRGSGGSAPCEPDAITPGPRIDQVLRHGLAAKRDAAQRGQRSGAARQRGEERGRREEQRCSRQLQALPRDVSSQYGGRDETCSISTGKGRDVSS
jgi:hypothetical protein